MLRKSVIEMEVFTALLAGNPNVGKSTLFNALTGLKQHTGNWAGKTVATAVGVFHTDDCQFVLTDLPGTYSLNGNSPDEEVAADAIMLDNADCVVMVADGSSLERCLPLVLQVLEITPKAVLCLNLMDEARKKHITIDLDRLSQMLGIPVIPTSARSRQGLHELTRTIQAVASHTINTAPPLLPYPPPIQTAAQIIASALPLDSRRRRFFSLKLLDRSKRRPLTEKMALPVTAELQAAFDKADSLMKSHTVSDEIMTCLISRSESIYHACVTTHGTFDRDRKLDRLLTSKATGIPIMLLLLALVFYITITAANVPSEWLHRGFASLYTLLDKLHCPPWLLDGVYTTLANVISVMLPPMAIFFPLFTLLEDFGYLPRVAFNLDKYFCKAGSNGKNALTMLMGFGCNACGVTGCRIISSPQQRKLAILTNTFTPCNGRFPMLIAVISIFLAGNHSVKSINCTLILTGVILLSVLVSLTVSKLLSMRFLSDKSDIFTLELPPFRKPPVVKTLVRSLLDRTVCILGRAVIAAAPCGALIWLLANCSVNGQTLANTCTAFLDPFARLMGLDGVILFSFLLGFPANEIVLPIAVMLYSSNGVMTEYESFSQLGSILTANGWTTETAICMLLFTVMHFPCATTCMTVFHETKSLKDTLYAFMIPTVCGIVSCMLVHMVWQIL